MKQVLDRLRSSPQQSPEHDDPDSNSSVMAMGYLAAFGSEIEPAIKALQPHARHHLANEQALLRQERAAGNGYIPLSMPEDPNEPIFSSSDEDTYPMTPDVFLKLKEAAKSSTEQASVSEEATPQQSKTQPPMRP